MILTGQAITQGYELATDAQFRELSNFSTPPRAGRVTAIEASGQVRVETDDPDGGDVLAWPLSGFTYAVNDVVYIAFAVNSPDSAIVIGSLGNLPTIDPSMLPFVKVNGTTPLTGDWDLGEDRAILAEVLKARDVEGLTIQDDGGNVAIVVLDGGGVVIGTLSGSVAANGDITIQGTTHATKSSSYVILQPNGGNVGIGTSTPPFLLCLEGDAAIGQMRRINGANVNRSPAFLFIRARGSVGAESDISAGDWLGKIQFQGRLSSVDTEHGAFGFIATDTSQNGYFGFFDRDLTSLRMAVFNSGGVLIGGLASMGATILGIKAGSSSNDFAPGGVLYQTTTQGANVGAGEDDLASYSVPANTLSANGMSVWFEAAGSCAANANTKTLRIRFGTSGTNLIVSATVTGSGAGAKWMAKGRVVRTGASTQKGYAEVNGANITTTVDVVTGLNQTLSGAVTLKITGEATSNNDIVLESFTVGWDDQNT